jgi:AraC family transcriptional regulator, transcriptional activator of pobA
MITSPKSFEYHTFLREVLRQSDDRSYVLASEQDFLKGSLPRFPYRNYFYGIGVVHSGTRKIRIGTEVFTIEPGSVMVIGPSILRLWLDDHFEARQDAIFFTPELFKPPIHPHFLTELPLFKSNIQHIFKPSEANFDALCRVFDLLKQYRNQPNVVASLTLGLIEMLSSIQPQDLHFGTEGTATSSRNKALLRNFDELLLKHYLENKDVAFYAEKLHLTANHLSETIKGITGKPAKKRIEEMLLLEAKSLLKQTDMTIKEITYWLGFEDPSYFVKFFKAAEGVTPNAYRQNP